MVVDVELRARLDAFEGRSPAEAWAWLVQVTPKVTGHDFAILTRRQSVDK